METVWPLHTVPHLSLSALFRTESMCVNEQAHFLWSCWLFIQRFLSSLGTLEQLPLPPLTWEIRARFWHTFFSDTLFEVLGSYSLWYYSVGQNFETSFWVQCRGGPCMKKALEKEQAPRWEPVIPRWQLCTFYGSFYLVQLRHSADFPKCFRGQRSDFPRPLWRSTASWLSEQCSTGLLGTGVPALTLVKLWIALQKVQCRARLCGYLDQTLVRFAAVVPLLVDVVLGMSVVSHLY